MLGATSRVQVYVIIPALNEEDALPHLVPQLHDAGADRLIVVDNGSTDRTGVVAKEAGAEVVTEARRGYGAACLAGLAALGSADPESIVAFFDADGSDDPGLLPLLVEPIAAGRVDFVLGSRTHVAGEPGSLGLTQRVGNQLACSLISLFWGERYTDLAPCRAVRFDALTSLHMRDQDFGWTVEMQIRAARRGLRTLEIPSPYRRRRAGRSKISGTVLGSLKAGVTILGVIGRELLVKPAGAQR